MILALIAVALSAVATFWAGYAQNRERVLSADQRAAFEKQLREKTEEIAGLQKTVLANVTGGDSYPRFTVIQGKTTGDRALIAVLNEGDHPLFDVQMTIVDLVLSRDALSSGPLKYEDFLVGRQNVALGNLGPHQALDLGLFQLPKERDYLEMNVFFTARNGFSATRVLGKRIGDGWQFALRTTRDGMTATSYEIDDLYPRRPDGTVDWEVIPGTDRPTRRQTSMAKD